MSKPEITGLMAHEHEQGVVMVCVTWQKTCERLVAAGERVAKERGAPLHVVHAVKTGEHFLGNLFEGEALDYLFTAAQMVDANLAVLRTDDVEAALTHYARVHAASAMVLGRSPEDLRETFEARMRKRLPEVDIITI